MLTGCIVLCCVVWKGRSEEGTRLLYSLAQATRGSVLIPGKKFKNFSFRERNEREVESTRGGQDLGDSRNVLGVWRKEGGEVLLEDLLNWFLRLPAPSDGGIHLRYTV